jgi:CBS domain containing-hemolysin-like protein
MAEPPLLLMAATAGELLLPWPEILLRLAAVVLLVLLNGFFVATEFSLVSVRRTRIEQLVEEGDRGALSVQRSQKDLDRYLSATQLGITIASLALGWIGEGTIAALIEPILGGFSIAAGSALAHTISTVVAFLLITYMHIVLGELAPKSVAILYPERTALLFAWPNEIFFKLFAPFLSFLNWSSWLVLRAFGVKANVNTHTNPIGPEELQLLISSSSASGLDKGEQELLENVFEFGDAVAIDVMVPRTSIDALPFTATIQEVLFEVSRTGHSRYPLYEDSLDTIKGQISIKDVITPLAKGEVQPADTVGALARPILFVPENKRISELLTQMQRERQAMVIVVDEFGGTAGLLTMENLLEELVGNITDESDQATPDIVKLDERTAIIQAQINLEELNDFLDLQLPISDEYKTLGGFVMYQLHKVPEAGEQFLYNELEFTVLEMEGPRLEQVRLVWRTHEEVEAAERLTAREAQANEIGR